MTYVDAFVLVVPKKNVKAYTQMAQQGRKTWMKHGALQYFECIGDDLHPKMCKLPFSKLAKLKKNETVWYSFIIFKSKAHRNAVNKKVMADPAMSAEAWKGKKMPFDMNRISYGGFKTVVQG
jgi:uncharacterized protein YbaA (DUF1428 family)